MIPRWAVWHVFWLLMGFALGGSFTWGFLSVPPERYLVDHERSEGNASKKEHLGEFWEKASDDPVAYFTLWLVGFTGVLAFSTIGLWIVTWRASANQSRDMKASISAAERAPDVSRQAMIAGERAFVFATGVMPFWEFDGTSNQYNWRFRPQWKNTGDTPTKNMVMATECLVLVAPLAHGFNYDEAASTTGTALIPPNPSTGGGLAPRSASPPITPQDIFEVQAQRKFLYLFGWTKYYDVFPETPQHITRFCWQILPLGDPFAFNPKIDEQGLKFPNVLHTEGNCSDDECRLVGLG